MVDIQINSRLWDENLDEHSQICCDAVKEVLICHDFNDISQEIEISINFSDDAHIQPLNLQYRKQDKATNVLAFPLDVDILSNLDKSSKQVQPIMLGDIVLAFETINRESIEQEKNFSHHLAHLIVHATLHLLGYDHIEKEMAENMENLEIKILKNLKIDNPYLN